MIPIFLPTALEKRLEEVFMHTKFKSSRDGEDVSLNIFTQSLPKRSKNEASLYPYVIVQLSEGEQSTESSIDQVKVMFVIGVFDEDNQNQGHQHVMRIINDISQNLKQNPNIEGQYQLSYPYRWVIHDEDTSPYFFGGIETTWEVSTYSRNDVEEFI